MKNIYNFINESKRGNHDLANWDGSNGKSLSDNILTELELQLKKFISSEDPFSNIQLKSLSKEVVMDIAGYIIEAYLYDLVTQSLSILISNNSKEFNDIDLTKIKPTKLAGRGLKNNVTNKPIYWDFSFNGLADKFEIKSLCKNGYHTGGFTKSDKLKNDSNVVYITCKYNATANGFSIDVNSIKVSRN